jgi:hypothetical protein
MGLCLCKMMVNIADGRNRRRWRMAWPAGDDGSGSRRDVLWAGEGMEKGHVVELERAAEG